MDLQALLNYPGALPAMSRTVTDLMAEMNKDDPDPRKVGELIAQDPSLTTRVLRLSNSSFFPAARSVTHTTPWPCWA
jgi:HD-like signal output (HDOD) protein